MEAEQTLQAGAKLPPVMYLRIIFFPVQQEHYFLNFLIRTEALCPPKPKVLLSATFTVLF